MFCKKCGKETDGKFCEFCGERQEEKLNLEKSVIRFFVGLVVLITGIISFAVAFFTMLSDLSFENYVFRGYDYIGPLTRHEIIIVCFTFVGFWCIYIGTIMVSTNKSEAACVNKSYKTVAHISYVVTAVLLVCAFMAAIPHFREGGYLGVSYPDFF